MILRQAERRDGWHTSRRSWYGEIIFGLLFSSVAFYMNARNGSSFELFCCWFVGSWILLGSSIFGHWTLADRRSLIFNGIRPDNEPQGSSFQFTCDTGHNKTHSDYIPYITLNRYTHFRNNHASLAFELASMPFPQPPDASPLSPSSTSNPVCPSSSFDHIDHIDHIELT
jgi:hypothetical protein